MTYKVALRKIYQGFIKFCPKFIKHAIVRKLVEIPKLPPNNLEIKFAETDMEFDEAFQLLQQCYLEVGIAEKDIRLRATKYHTLPTSSVVIAKFEGRVIATLTHVLDNPLGLPIEEHWSIHEMRGRGELIAEISSLAIKKEWRHHYGLFLFLTKFTLDYAIRILGVDTWVIVTHPKAKTFYEGLLCFQPLSEEVHKCSYVKGAEGVAQKLNLKTLKSQFLKIYNNKKYSKNIHDFYFVNKYFNIFQTIKSSDVFVNSMNMKYFVQLFFRETKLMEILNESELKTLISLYSKALPQYSSSVSTRVKHRSPTLLNATLESEDKIYPVRVLNVSSGGAKVLCSSKINPGKNWILKVKSKNERVYEVPVKIAWTRDDLTQGMSVVGNPPEDWLLWTQDLENQFHQALHRWAS